MGRIRTKDIKRVGNEIVALQGERYTADFTGNKKQIDQIGLHTSKRIRNKLTGYVTRRRKIQIRNTQ